jgi:hypothetical protein
MLLVRVEFDTKDSEYIYAASWAFTDEQVSELKDSFSGLLEERMAMAWRNYKRREELANRL